MEEVQKKWISLREQDSDTCPGDEYEVPNEVWSYMHLFDSAGRYYTDDIHQLAHDPYFYSPGLASMVQGIRQQAQLQTHPRARQDGAAGGFFAEDLPPAEEMAGWYDIVCYGSASDDGYRNGRSNEGLMKLEVQAGADGKSGVHGELRPTSQQYLSDFCGLRYTISEAGRSGGNGCGEMEIEFDAPDRFAEDMEVERIAKLRIFNERVAMRWDEEGRGDHPGYGVSIPLDEADRLMWAYRQSSKSKESPAPVLYFEKGDVCINSKWVYMGTSRTEVAFIARKRLP